MPGGSGTSQARRVRVTRAPARAECPAALPVPSSSDALTAPPAPCARPPTQSAAATLTIRGERTVPTPAALPHLMDRVEDLLTPGEVARLFRVDPKTVIRWEKEGQLTSVKTLGGHRRYPRTQITHMMKAERDDDAVICALEEVHHLALETGAVRDADRIAVLIATLRADG